MEPSAVRTHVPEISGKKSAGQEETQGCNRVLFNVNPIPPLSSLCPFSFFLLQPYGNIFLPLWFLWLSVPVINYIIRIIPGDPVLTPKSPSNVSPHIRHMPSHIPKLAGLGSDVQTRCGWMRSPRHWHIQGGTRRAAPTVTQGLPSLPRKQTRGGRGKTGAQKVRFIL